MAVLILLMIILSIYVIYSIIYTYIKKKEMGCLTGKYYHLKKANSYIIKIEYSDNGFLKFRKANFKEISLLRKYKYLS